MEFYFRLFFRRSESQIRARLSVDTCKGGLRKESLLKLIFSPSFRAVLFFQNWYIQLRSAATWVRTSTSAAFEANALPTEALWRLYTNIDLLKSLCFEILIFDKGIFALF